MVAYIRAASDEQLLRRQRPGLRRTNRARQDRDGFVLRKVLFGGKGVHVGLNSKARRLGEGFV